MIYVPDTSYSCYVVQSEEIIRAYSQMPNYGSTVNYRDYYIRSDYIYKDGIQSFGNYSTLPICLETSVLTDDFYYRVDLDSILVIFAIMAFFCLFLPIKIFSKFFKRGSL